MRTSIIVSKLMFLVLFYLNFSEICLASNQKPKIKNSPPANIYKDDDGDNDDEDAYKKEEKSKDDNKNPTHKNLNIENLDLGDLGILKEIVSEQKIDIKKLNEEDDKIFLSKEIFDEKNKEKLRQDLLKKVRIDYVDKLKISNRIVSDLSLTNNFGNNKNRFHDTNGVIRHYLEIKINNNLELYSLARLARFDNNHDLNKRNNDAKGGGSRTFENMGINLSELNLKYSQDNKSLILGKFTANFGTAWRWNRAIFMHSLPQNYALNEKLGFAVIAKYGDIKKTGLYNLSFSAFTNDRKNLDNSLFHRKNSDSKSDAIAGDTRKLSSFVIANDINFEFKENEKLSYHMAYSRLAINKNASAIAIDKIKDQSGAVFGMNYKFPLALKLNSKSNSRLTGEVLIELTNIKNINGNTDISQNYLTSNFVLKYNSKYSLTLGNSRNKNKNLLASRSRNNISELNIGYEFFKNKFFDKLTTQIGYYQTIIKSDSLNRKDKAFAILVRYYKNF